MYRPLLLCVAFSIAACNGTDTEKQISLFCDTLNAVNAGSINTDGSPELNGHVLILKTLLGNAPPSLKKDLRRIHDTVDAWASAISGDRPMIKIFAVLTAPELVGSEGRVTDFVAVHCGIDLGGKPWKEAQRPSAQSICPAWPRVGTPATFNNFPNLPDIAGSNYFANDFVISKAAAMLGINKLQGAFVVEPGGKVEIHGQYPRARYFAYHPNDMDLNNLPTLRDKDLNPDEGSINPFRELPSQESKNYYTATLVFSAPPANPAPNTRYVGVRKDGSTKNNFVVNLLRMYHVDAGNRPGSGEVPLPAVTIYKANGEVDKQFAECDLFAPGNEELKTDMVFPALPIIDHRPRNPPQWTTSSNFDAPSDTMANADVQYLATHYSQRFGELLVTRAKYLSAPNTRAGEPHSAPDKDVRLYNLCTYNFWNGGAIQCLLENDLRVDAAGFYTLVVSSEKNQPKNLMATHATWLDWGPYLDGQLQFRFVYRENPYVAAIAKAANRQDIANELLPYVPAAVPCDASTYENGGWQACFIKSKKDITPYL
ncbi:MAG: hypothetical protein ACR2P1_05700, partial [Pseudomonadales bacterium]